MEEQEAQKSLRKSFFTPYQGIIMQTLLKRIWNQKITGLCTVDLMMGNVSQEAVPKK